MKRFLVVLSVILVGVLIVQANQVFSLKKQYQTVQADYTKSQKAHKVVQQIARQPLIQQTNLKASQERVKEFIDTVMNNKATAYPDKLGGYATHKVINQLINTFAPSVTSSTLANYDVPVVAVNRQWDNKADFLVIAKSDVQSVAWLVDYDVINQKVTNVTRLVLKGAFDNER